MTKHAGAATAKSRAIPNTSPQRLCDGFHRLLAACNKRLLSELPSPGQPQNDPRYLLNYSLGYVATGIAACQTLFRHPWPAHSLSIARPLFEHSSRVLWAVRNRWPRYWSWAALQYVQRCEKAAPFVPQLVPTLQSAPFAAAKLTSAGFGMPDLATVLEDLATDDAADSESPEHALGIKIQPRDGRQQYHSILALELHLAAHGNPDIFQLDESAVAGRMAWLLSYSAMNIARACHIQCGWRQAPLFWSYGWITRGRKEPTEPTPPPADSYGDLELPPL